MSKNRHIDINNANAHAGSRLLHSSAMHHMIQRGRLDLNDKQAELVFLVLTLGGESGELGNIVKKMWRDGFQNDSLYEDLRLEVADVYAYLLHIANLSGFDLNDVLAEKVSIIVNERRPKWAQEAIEGMLAAQQTLNELIPADVTTTNDPRIIAFTGPKESGKDTMASVLFRQNVDSQINIFQRQPFAYGVKTICQETFGWSMEEQDNPDFKETPLVEWPSIEPRWAMMDIANFMREKYGPDVWVHALRRRLDKDLASANPAGAYVITDLRFPNEIEFLKARDALIIYVERDEAEDRLAKAKAAGDEKALNPSETHYAQMKAEADIIIDNNRDIHKGHADVLSAVRNKFGFWGYWYRQAFNAHQGGAHE